jgi:PAS domain S-box-containing protein
MSGSTERAEAASRPAAAPSVDSYRLLVDAIADYAIFLLDPLGNVATWSAGSRRLTGYEPADILGRRFSVLYATDDATVGDAEALLSDARAEGRSEAESRCRRKDGTVFHAVLTLTALRDANAMPEGFAAVVRDVTDLRDREREIHRLTRLYAALSHINQAIVWTRSREELFPQVCRVLVEDGGLAMAWIGWNDEASGRLVPVAVWGDEFGYLDSVSIRTAEGPEGGGPSGAAFRAGQSYVCNDVFADDATQPWRPAMRRSGFQASAAFVIRRKGSVAGTLNVYASRRGFFHDKEIALLEEAATDLSFALDNFVREEEHERAERTVHEEKEFSDSMIQSMPGILYFYDSTGSFLRWNRNFETVSGYAPEEIARMHPRDFFSDAEKPLLEARIAEVFEMGESAVEAEFVSKDGTATPYFLTGKRVFYKGNLCLIGVGIDVSDRRHAEDRLAESEREYRELVEHANSIILRWDVEGRITFLNEFGLSFFGYRTEEIVGRPAIGTIVPLTESGGRDLGRLIRQIVADPEAYQQNVNENMRRNGERVWIAWTNRVERDEAGNVVGLLSIGTDISERRRTEARIRESEAHLREAQRIARIGSWELDLHSRRLRWSEQIGEIFGVPLTVFGGTYEAFLEYVHPDDRVRLQAAQEEALAGRARLDIEHRIVLRDGTEKVVHEMADLKRDAEGNPVCLSGIVHDITDRIRIDEEREKRLRAEAADRVKSAFLATMSHELRTPLNSILGFTGILLQGLAGPLNDEQTKQLGMVRGSARHLLELIKDVLDISKIEAGQLEARSEPFDLPAIIERVTASVRPLADRKGLALEASVDPGLAEMVSDPRRVEQILLNLLNNAIKFTDRGSVTLKVDRVDGGGSDQDAVRMQVTDTGIGIREDDLELLFQPFRQLDSGLARQHEGTGLGLAICRRLAGLLGGEITATSRWEEGSVFTVTLPLQRKD